MRIKNLKNSEGYALIIALLMLLVLTIIGISAITTTTFETAISGNERIGTDAFYSAEAGIQVAINKLPDLTPTYRTKLDEDSYYWGYSNYLGNISEEGFKINEGSGWIFNLYQVDASGESFGATKEIEVKVRFGPLPKN